MPKTPNFFREIRRFLLLKIEMILTNHLTITSKSVIIVFVNTIREVNMEKFNGNFWKVWSQTNALYTEWCAERNYNPYRLLVLYAAYGHEPITQKQIANRTGLSKQTVATVMRGLKDENFVSMSAGMDDRREKYIRLTEQGNAYAGEMLVPLYELETRVFDIMGEERIRQMMDAVSLFNTVFEKEMRIIYDENRQK